MDLPSANGFLRTESLFLIDSLIFTHLAATTTGRDLPREGAAISRIPTRAGMRSGYTGQTDGLDIFTSEDT
jgi:hypothetical protein